MAGVLLEPLARRRAGKMPDDLVLTSPEGSVLLSGKFRQRVFDRAATAVGLEDLSPHDLRHTAASLLVASVKAARRPVDLQKRQWAGAARTHGPGIMRPIWASPGSGRS